MILSGGSGTRLWPLSTPGRPKQFADLVPGGASMFHATLTRLSGLPGLGVPIVVTGADHLGLVESALTDAEMVGSVVIVEPVGRNTAPAVAAAVTVADPDDVLVILPSDHLIADLDRFRGHVGEAVGHARAGAIVTFGVVPTRPDTGYGYLEVGDAQDGAHRLAGFKEKPGPEEAQALVADGHHLWNSGMFVAQAGHLEEEMSRTSPEVLIGVRDAVGPAEGEVIRLGPGFARVEAISFDHAVMERTDRGIVIPIDVGWDDLGSYLALFGHAVKDRRGNAVSGRVVLDDVDDSLVMATWRVVAVAGLSSVVVVETPEAVLVVPLDRAQMVRDLVEQVDQTEQG